MTSAGARSNFGIKLIAKSAMLWLTAGVFFASVYGSLLATRSSSHPLIIPHSVSAPVSIPVLAMNEETLAD